MHSSGVGSRSAAPPQPPGRAAGSADNGSPSRPLPRAATSSGPWGLHTAACAPEVGENRQRRSSRGSGVRESNRWHMGQASGGQQAAIDRSQAGRHTRQQPAAPHLRLLLGFLLNHHQQLRLGRELRATPTWEGVRATTTWKGVAATAAVSRAAAARRRVGALHPQRRYRRAAGKAAASAAPDRFHLHTSPHLQALGVLNLGARGFGQQLSLRERPVLAAACGCSLGLVLRAGNAVWGKQQVKVQHLANDEQQMGPTNEQQMGSALGAQEGESSRGGGGSSAFQGCPLPAAQRPVVLGPTCAASWRSTSPSPTSSLPPTSTF